MASTIGEHVSNWCSYGRHREIPEELKGLECRYIEDGVCVLAKLAVDATYEQTVIEQTPTQKPTLRVIDGELE